MTQFNPRTLAGLTYLAHLELGDLAQGQATGGSGTTIVDTNFLTSVYAVDDYWNGGTAWLLSGGILDGGGQMSRISDFATSSQTVTVVDTFSPVCDALTQYALANQRYPMHNLIAAVNRAVFQMGKIVYTRTADYTTAAAQTEYGLVEQTDAADLPVVIDADAEVLKVEIQTNLNDSDDNQWRNLDIPWMLIKSNPGAMNVLELQWQPPYAYALRVTLRGQHPALFQYGARAWVELDQGIPFQLVALRAAYYLLQQEYNNDISHPRLKDMLDRLQAMNQQAETRFQPDKPANRPILFNLPNQAGSTSIRYREYPGQ